MGTILHKSSPDEQLPLTTCVYEEKKGSIQIFHILFKIYPIYNESIR